MGEIRFVGTGETRGYPYLVCKKRIVRPGKTRGYPYPVCKKKLIKPPPHIFCKTMVEQKEYIHKEKHVQNYLRAMGIMNRTYSPGPGCSKLTTSLVNVSLKFEMFISEIRQYFLLKNCEKLLHCKSFSHFFNKNITVFGYKVVKHLTS